MDKTFMENYDFYDPLKHNGYLPVRVLRYNFLEWFQSATPDFINEINYESESNGFSPLVGYNINRIPIKTVAEIDSQKRIIRMCCGSGGWQSSRHIQCYIANQI